MATKTFEELKQLAIQIRDEKTNKQNTATRVGTEMLEHLNKLEQDYYDKTTINNRTSEYNVSLNHPTSGLSGSNKYDLSSAIAQVPAELRTAGLTVSFLNADGNTEKWEFSGSSWAVGKFSQVGAEKLTELSDESKKVSNEIKDNKKETQKFYDNSDSIIVTDSNGNILLHISENGLKIKKIISEILSVNAIDGEGFLKALTDNIKKINYTDIFSEKDSISFMDKAGNIALLINNEGVHFKEKQKEKITSNLLADVNMILQYGQSLSVYGSPDHSLSTFKYPSNCLGFSNIDGVNFQHIYIDDIDSYDFDTYLGEDFKELVLGDQIHGVGDFGFYYSKLLMEHNGYKEEELPKFLLASCGVPGWGVVQLTNTVNVYNRLLGAVKQGMKIASKKGLSFNVPFLSWLQGEAESSINPNNESYRNGGYKTALLELFDKINTDIKNITKQSNDVIFVCYSLASEVNTTDKSDTSKAIPYEGKNDVALQIMDAVIERENIVHGASLYIYQHGDGLHANLVGCYRHIGSLNALQAYNIVENKREISPLIPLNYYITEDNGIYRIVLNFDVKYPPLNFGKAGGTYITGIINSNYDSIKYHGFRMLKEESQDFSTDNTNIITDVSISKNGRSVIIQCSENPAGLLLTYAWDGYLGGGDLRDSANTINPLCEFLSPNKDEKYTLNSYQFDGLI